MLLNQLQNLVDLDGFEAAGLRKDQRIEPHFRDLFLAPHVNVRRLISIERDEEEPISIDSQDRGHSILLYLADG